MRTYIDTIESDKDLKDVLEKLTVIKLKELLKINGCVKYSKLNRRELCIYLVMLNACRCIQKYYIKWNLKILNEVDPITLENLSDYPKKIIYERIMKIGSVNYCSRYIINKYADYILASGDLNDIFTKIPLTIKDMTVIDTQLLNNNLHYPRLKLLLSKKPVKSYDFLMGLERQLNEHITQIRDFCTGDLYIDSTDLTESSESTYGDSVHATINYLEMTYYYDIQYIINRIRDVDTEFARFVINDIIEYIKHPHNNPDNVLVNNVLNMIYNI